MGLPPSSCRSPRQQRSGVEGREGKGAKRATRGEYWNQASRTEPGGRGAGLRRGGSLAAPALHEVTASFTFSP